MIKHLGDMNDLCGITAAFPSPRIRAAFAARIRYDASESARDRTDPARFRAVRYDDEIKFYFSVAFPRSVMGSTRTPSAFIISR